MKTIESSTFISTMYSPKNEGEAFVIVTNVSGQNGGGAWRKVCRRRCSNVITKIPHVFRGRINPPQSKTIWARYAPSGQVGGGCRTSSVGIQRGAERWSQGVNLGGYGCTRNQA